MKTYTKQELDEILRLHLLWLKGDKNGLRANLSFANLRSADLSSANLRSADLRFADLRSADLRSADLRSADLSFADLSSANLSSANLRSADLRSADLSSANLRFADLSFADLRSADLRSADLRSADLIFADLSSANLSSANLRSADLRSANLRSANLNNETIIELYKLSIVPESGSFTGYKKSKEGVIIELEIQKSAKRLNPIGYRKCRASKVKIVRFIDSKKKVLHSSFDPLFTYKIGQVITVKDFDEDLTKDCSTGIHFFLTKREAQEY